ncbi:OmpA family protein [Acidocella aromatica]|uniref:Outer membrane protein OmpA-like peptidoglycan-associated protein n=1 Tax=Acidocella aromatica TaxID=1303579 RepID=A0A840VB23_9PROT|nr:OmpA family protein [Acidocella aromatica]MBB5372906.1 outer membrane protein OmpA-like peptidoglycan-associated protein [Acidocella aromatica]
MNLRLVLAAATCFSLPLAVHAQPVSGPYIGLEAGTSFQQPVKYNESLGGSFGKTLYRESYAGDAYAGYGFGNGWRVQLEVDDLHSTLAETQNSAYGHVSSNGTRSSFGPMVNALYDFNASLPVFPYIGAGMGYQWTHLSSRDPNFAYGGTEGSPAFDVIVGLSYPVPWVRGLSATAEYRYMQLFSDTTMHGTVDGVSDNIKFRSASSHNLFLGLRYQLFSPPPLAPVPAAAAAPEAAPAPAPAKTYLVFFDWNKASLNPRATQIISQAASDSKTQNVTTLNVSGYTDTSGTPQYNQGLSERRAKAVAAQLVRDGVPASEIEIHAYGETHLLVSTGPDVREPQNRRVEIVLQ